MAWRLVPTRARTLRLKELYQQEGGKYPDPIVNLTWAYTTPEVPSLAEVAKEINGKALSDITLDT